MIIDSMASTRSVSEPMASTTRIEEPVGSAGPSVTASYSRTDSLMAIWTLPVPFRSAGMVRYTLP